MKKILLFFLFFLAIPASAASVQDVTSARGIKAWLVEDQSLPVVSFAFLWRGGMEGDGEGRQGLSQVTTALLTRGAGDDDANAFMNRLKENAITLDFNARRDAITGVMRSLKETLPTARQMLRDSLFAPRFDESAVALVKEQLAVMRNNYLSDPNWLLSRLMVSQLFEGQPYALRTMGTEKTVAALTRKDFLAWRERLARGNLVVAAAGAITAEELKILLDDIFGDLPAQRMVSSLPDVTLKHKGETVVLAHEGPQTAMAIVWPGIPDNDPSRFSYEVLNYIFGGGSFSSRLMNEIRDKRGLTYGISSHAENYDKAALYVVEASMQNEKAGEVLALVRKEALRLMNESVGDEELEAAKDYLTGAYALQQTSTMKVAAHYLELQRLQRGKDEQDIREKAIRAVTKDDVQKLARRLFGAPQSVFLVGKPQGIGATKTLLTLE